MRLVPKLACVVPLLALLLSPSQPTSAAETPPDIYNFSKPAAGSMQIFFHGGSGPFLIQTRKSLDPAAPWIDLPDASVTEVRPGVLMGLVPSPAGTVDLNFYRIVSEGGEAAADLQGWTVLLRTSVPANGQFFVAGESPVVTVTILDTMGQGLKRTDFGSLSLYMYGPQDPQLTVTAAKLLNATTDRTKTPHHFIDLKTNPDVQVTGNVLTYTLKPVTDELPGTYTISLSVTLAADPIQQMMKFANVQIGTKDVETPLFTKESCAKCHEGPVSGKIYMHHIDPGRSPTGSWALDYQPDQSCKACHNNNGYAAYTDATGTRIPDPIVFRAHGLHMGAELKLAANTNSTNGLFRNYTHVEFPADIKDCKQCHTDDRYLAAPSRLACGSCHDNTWFGPKPAPEGYELHGGLAQADDKKCSLCHDEQSIVENHTIKPPAIDAVELSMTPPTNGKFYAAGDKPVVTVVMKDDKGNPIDHTQVTDANFSTASLFVYGPRARAVPVLTSAAKNVNSKLRASVTSSKAGPWDINGKIFKISVNGSAPQEITIVGTPGAVTAAEVAASLNSVITNLNGGAKATVSGANVNIRTIIQGANAKFEIYNGDVTTAMGWKRAPNTVMEPDVTIAAATTPSNDLRGLSDPLDYSDPMVTRTAANIAYQLDDMQGLASGTYNVYVYQLPKTGKVAGMTNLTGFGHMTFQVGSTNIEKRIAMNCEDCHSDTIFHFASGPIHAEPFDVDYCAACHDYGHTTIGDKFKNQGGTSLAGWSGFGAMPIVNRVHGVHKGAYLDYPEEIYANATKDTFGHIIFPQDLRNCTKCHAESDTWKQKPSRMACLACHDSDAAQAHGRIMTFMPNPNDPYGPDAQESCEICHGAGADFSPDKVHQISKPYVPPYPRE